MGMIERKLHYCSVLHDKCDEHPRSPPPGGRNKCGSRPEPEPGRGSPVPVPAHQAHPIDPPSRPGKMSSSSSSSPSTSIKLGIEACICTPIYSGGGRRWE